jgi:hypothetical protein
MPPQGTGALRRHVIRAPPQHIAISGRIRAMELMGLILNWHDVSERDMVFWNCQASHDQL